LQWYILWWEYFSYFYHF